MAKFSQTFLQGLLQPSYQEGLFTAARQAAQLPAQLQQQKMQGTLQSGLFQLEQKAMAGTLTPEEYQKAVTAYGQVAQASPELAGEIRSSLSRVGTAVGAQKRATDQNRVKSEVANLRQAALAVQSNKQLDPEQKRQTLAKMKIEFNRIKKANPTVDLSSFEGMFEDVVVEAAQLDKIAKEAADSEARDRLSAQIFQVKNFEALETLTDSLLKTNPEQAEAIKKFSQIQQTSIENKRKRAEARVEREYDITTDVSTISKQAEDLPDSVRELVQAKLTAAEQEQQKYRKGDVWTNSIARKRAESLIEDAVSQIERFTFAEAGRTLTQITSLESDLAELAAQGEPTAEPLEIMRVAEGLALQKHGRDYSDLPQGKQQSIYEEAVQAESERVKASYQREITVKTRQLSALRGEEVAEEETETPEVAPIKGMDDYDGMVRQALSRNQDPATIVESLRAIGVPTKRLVALADKYKLPLFD